MRIEKYLLLFLISFSCFFKGNLYSQCVAFDGNGILVNNPSWLSCFGTNFTLNFQSTSTFGDYTIDWGDGSPVEN